jgi:hypothetical protein
MIPNELRQQTKLSDANSVGLLNLQREQLQYDFGDGTYVAMPKDPRGIQLINMRKASEA